MNFSQESVPSATAVAGHQQHITTGHLLSESIIQRGLVPLCGVYTKFGEETFLDKGKS